MKKRLFHSKFIFFFFFFSAFVAVSQPKVDSLLNALHKANDTSKVKILNKLAEAYTVSDKVKAEDYAKKAHTAARALEMKAEQGQALHTLGRIHLLQNDNTGALPYFEKAVQIRTVINDFEGLHKSLNNVAIILVEQGLYEKAFAVHQRSLDAAQKAKYEKGIATAYLGLGGCYNYLGKYIDALKNYQKAAAIYEKIGNQEGVGSCLINTGLVYQTLRKPREALKSFKEAYEIHKKRNDKLKMGEAVNDIAIIYVDTILKRDKPNRDLYKPDSAIYYVKKGIEYFTEAGYQRGVTSGHNNLGTIYMFNKKYAKAIEHYSYALKISKELGSVYEIAMNSIGLGQSYLGLGQKQEAVDYLREAITVSKASNSNELLMMGYESLAYAYDSSKMYKDAYQCMRLYKDTRERVRDSAARKVIEEMEKKYRSEKQEQQIAAQQRDNARQMEINKSQRIIIYFAIGALVVFLGLSIMIFLQYSQKRKANALLVLQNEEIMQQKEEIEAQRDQIQEQRNEVVKQRDLIEEQQQGIMDSIHYASRIQRAILPLPETVAESLNIFVLFKPRDIVSGDFYWIGKKWNKRIIVAADCTGHGVPGAFMSMLGTAFLNEIVNSHSEALPPHEILNKMREQVIISLKQTGKEGEQKDGMDLSLYIYDEINNTIQYAGANNPLFIVRKKDNAPAIEETSRISFDELTNEETGEIYQIIHIKADKMPIGIYAKMDSFVSVDFQLQKGDCLYNFSDGYVDQFGGPAGKKFMTKHFKQLLVSVAGKSMVEQRDIIDKANEAWKHPEQEHFEQVDDILVIGLYI